MLLKRILEPGFHWCISLVCLDSERPESSAALSGDRKISEHLHMPGNTADVQLKLIDCQFASNR